MSHELLISTLRVTAPSRFNVNAAIIIGAHLATITDQLLRVDPTAGAFPLTLPSVVSAGSGFLLLIKNESGSTNLITLTPDADIPDTIDGAASLIMNQARQSVILIGDGVKNWMRFGA